MSLVVFSILLGLVAIAYLLTDVPKAAGAYNRNHAAALRAKLPMSDAELERMRAVPDADNAALTLGPVIQDLVTIRKADTFNYNDKTEDIARKACRSSRPTFRSSSARAASPISRRNSSFGPARLRHTSAPCPIVIWS
ncbi:MAG: hypothetical protein GC165_00390 [Armatimonadetes bacterium]|nr:hypothetical protein [Armatimonadota bacterium]